MKCIHCESDARLKDRSGGKCPKCGHRFAFEPTTDPHKVADGLFNGAIQAVSGKGELFFTERQLYWEFARALKRKQLPGCALGKKKKLVGTEPLAPPIPHSTFVGSYLAKWVDVHGRPEKLIGLPTTPPPPVPEELSSYSFDRALIVEGAELAAMLVANRFHFENNCAILSKDRRYPIGATFETVKQMLGRNPNLAVFAVHDCSANGMELASMLRTESWFPDAGVRIYDLGLRPSQIPPGERLGVPGTSPAQVGAVGIADADRAWLAAGHEVELATLRPAKLMKAAYLGFSQVSQYAGGDVWIDSGYGYYYIDSGYPIWGSGADMGGTVLDGGSYDSFG